MKGGQQTDVPRPVCEDEGKAIYVSEKAARGAIKGLKRARRDGGGHLHAYRCGGHWHVGHGHKETSRTRGRKFK